MQSPARERAAAVLHESTKVFGGNSVKRKSIRSQRAEREEAGSVKCTSTGERKDNIVPKRKKKGEGWRKSIARFFPVSSLFARADHSVHGDGTLSF